VHNAPIERVGDLAGGAGITLHELAAVQGSLEEAFMQLTGDSVEYGGQRFTAGADPMVPTGPPQNTFAPPMPATMTTTTGQDGTHR
jgi:ABC-2 type transport system ATP-binding protein